MSRKVIQYSAASGRFIAEHNSIQEASRVTKIHTSSISANLRKIRSSASGYVFKYKDVIAK